MKRDALNIKFGQLFLEIISLSPILIVLGNLLPPIGLKIHYYPFGFLFIMAFVWVITQKSKKWLAYVFIIYLILQFSLWKWNIKSFVDFFFGPFTLVVMMDLLLQENVPKKVLKKYLNRFVILAFVPVTISVFQFFNVLPIRFLEAQYLNYAYFSDGSKIPRPNGFLYHGSELCIIIFFLGAIQLFKPANKALTWLTILFICSALTMFKSISITMIILLLYYIVFIDREIFYHFKLMSKKRLFSYLTLLGIGICALLATYFWVVYSYTGHFFHPTLLTGRGSIWNVYVEGLKDFTFWNWLFGSGMGSEFTIFGDYATPEMYYPLRVDPVLHDFHGTHNSILGLFVNSGFIGIVVIGFLFYIIYRNLKLKVNSSIFKKQYFALVILPVFTFGITIPIFEMAIYWPLIGFSIYYWYLSQHELDQ